MKWRRYQLRKEAVGVALRHPWVFRDHLSSAASVFRDGERLRLVDGQNRVVGYGLYDATGAIAIRMLRRGAIAPDAAWLRGQLAAAVKKRAALATHTDAIRLVHGESDGIPALVVDRFADTLVISSYATGADALARYAARALATGLAATPGTGNPALRAIIGPAHHVVLRPARLRQRPDVRDGSGEAHEPPEAHEAHRTHDATDPQDAVVAIGAPALPIDLETSTVDTTTTAIDLDLRTAAPGAAQRPAPEPARILRGAPPAVVGITEHGLALAVDLAGQKTGTYLDLRGLRRELAAAPLAGARVLNLFAYSGMLGRAAEAAGAAAIVQVDASERALAFARAHHVTAPDRHTFVVADVFDWLPALAAPELARPFDLVIVDPPSMTSKAAQVPGVLAAYRKLYRAAAHLVRPGGTLVAACCTSRIERAVFQRTVRDALGAAFTLDHELAPEPDHPVGFPQADYLKITWWVRSP